MITSLMRLLGVPYKPKKFEITDPNFGKHRNERAVEIPWALSKYKGEKTVLEIGPVDAEQTWLDELRRLRIPSLHGLDITEENVSGFKMHFGDIRNTDFEDNKFDLIFCISTLEHVGRDNKHYHPSHELDREENGDIKGLKEIVRITKPGGRILLTVPFGKYQDHGWFVQYDSKYLDRLIQAADVNVLEESYYRYDDAWKKEEKRDLLSDREYRGSGATNASALVCLELQKPKN